MPKVSNEMSHLFCPQVADGINSTTSTLTLRPDVDDDGKELACRAENLKFPGGILEDRRYIRVACTYNFYTLTAD